MGLTALVMAGGKGARLRSDIEKPLVQIGGAPMIQLVLEAVRCSMSVDRVVVAVGPTNTQTAQKARELGAEVIVTPAAGYENDMKTVIKELGLRDVLVVSADIPFLTGGMVDRAIETYRSSGKPALSVMCPITVFEKMRIQPSHVFDVEGKRLVPIGVNIIDGTRIDEPVLDETVLITESKELALNVNTQQELELASRVAKKRNLRGHLT
jgi:adenosylcobinamide-phosphate guanylyltransferase